MKKLRNCVKNLLPPVAMAATVFIKEVEVVGEANAETQRMWFYFADIVGGCNSCIFTHSGAAVSVTTVSPCILLTGLG